MTVPQNMLNELRRSLEDIGQSKQAKVRTAHSKQEDTVERYSTTIRQRGHVDGGRSVFILI